MEPFRIHAAARGAIEIEADVLVLGGGPAGTWAAVAAANAGARVVLADKGFCGTSGATAPSGNSIWYVPPDTDRRQAAAASREALGGYLADRRWSMRVLDKTYTGLDYLAERGYPFPQDDGGASARGSLQGPEYMRLMRKLVKGARVRILDHSPALELLVDGGGAVAGARGVRRQKGDDWVVKAGAVVIATGGCAFLSGALGCNVLTGDGLLMAAELGAELSGMEFSNAYGISPAFASVTKTLLYKWATFTDPEGQPIPGAASQGGRSVIAKWLAKGPVYAQLDKADPALRLSMREAQPNFFLPFDRAGIDPFEQRFPITLRLEGTVRGTGGLRIVGDDCATTVPGLYAAGDAATRELICGGFTGGGSHNAAWAISSGQWAGAGAAAFARRARLGADIIGAGRVALREGRARANDPAATIRAVQEEVFPYERNYFRSGPKLDASLARLDRLWSDLRMADAASLENVIRAREAAAMTAVARWMYRSAGVRTESRGMHRREDYPTVDPSQLHHVYSCGLDDVWAASAAPLVRQQAEVAA
ncbi:FAD-dependent oxidoreductase [Pseudochelatococcus contaminans]|uniref:Succinate dehydrogenase/fumarate reductase flavoprotein subunit n=1 Tax=Pseudochelatococcus contaminans TaxID=1538103 RepID=A0A7W5Z5X0_9HYPH|nr:FAD-binding protein [Pseudochelatococcus contaminans]MBB3810287.1 succinate dehydrogenase/fumarate reductase flavoprotein subunit [Pseudochelatococcus contaminans]